MKSKSLYDCLNYIQVNLNAPKNLHNAFGNYKYRNLEGIFEGLKPLLKETGCVITVTDYVELIGDRYYVKAVAFLQKGDDSTCCTAYAREMADRKGMDESQITGSASSYARKYALNGLFAIDDSQDADTMNNEYTITDPQKEEYQRLLHHDAFKGEHQKINKWWSGFSTHKQAEKGLIVMQKRVDAHDEKASVNGQVEKEVA